MRTIHNDTIARYSLGHLSTNHMLAYRYRNKPAWDRISLTTCSCTIIAEEYNTTFLGMENIIDSRNYPISYQYDCTDIQFTLEIQQHKLRCDNNIVR